MTHSFKCYIEGEYIVLLYKTTRKDKLCLWSQIIKCDLTCLIADTESQVEGDDPRHGPGHSLHGEGAFTAVQQGHQRRNICQPAANPSAKTTHPQQRQRKRIYFSRPPKNQEHNHINLPLPCI